MKTIVELSKNLKLLWNDLEIEKDKIKDTEKELKKNLKKCKTFDEIYMERCGDKKFQLIMDNNGELFGTNYLVDLKDNHIRKKRYGFIVNDDNWRGNMIELIKKIVIMENEDK